MAEPTAQNRCFIMVSPGLFRIGDGGRRLVMPSHTVLQGVNDNGVVTCDPTAVVLQRWNHPHFIGPLVEIDGTVGSVVKNLTLDGHFYMQANGQPSQTMWDASLLRWQKSTPASQTPIAHPLDIHLNAALFNNFNLLVH